MVPGQVGVVGASQDTPASSRRGRGRPKKGHTLLHGSAAKRGPKPKYHTPDAAAKAGGVVAGTARPSFDTDSFAHELSDSDLDLRKRVESVKTLVDVPSNSDTLGSSDLDTDFSAEEELPLPPQPVAAKTVKSPKANNKTTKQNICKPALKLKIKLPPQPDKRK